MTVGGTEGRCYAFLEIFGKWRPPWRRKSFWIGTGDTRHEFDSRDAAAVVEAERRFRELTGLGFTAAARRGDGSVELVRRFDSAAEDTLFFPRLQGG
jgi:hypothetical protein